MKRYFFFSILLLSLSTVYAQLKVDSCGNVQIGETGNVDAKLLIDMNNTENGIFCNYNTTTNTIGNGIYCSVTSTQGTAFRGILGAARGRYNTKYMIGVDGVSSGHRSSAGIPLGVAGRFSSTNSAHKGAGIFGSTQYNYSFTFIDSLYAGFFQGLTKVQGNLIVTGGINGTVLTTGRGASGVSAKALSSEGNNLIIGKLSTLETNAFLYDVPEMMKEAMAEANTPSKVVTTIHTDLADEELMEEELSSDLRKEDKIEISAIEYQLYSKQHYGIDADELQEVFPDLVYENEDGTKSINYVEMVPILVQAINELSAKVKSLEEKQESAAKKLPLRTTNLEAADEQVTILSLGQNRPNPFGVSTSIDISIPETVQQAFIYVYDLQGKKVEQVNIAARGKQSIQLNSSNLADGMYLYSLIVDGKVVETRRMIVEK